MSSKDPDVPLFVNLNHSNPAVNEAVSEARRTLPRFLEAAAKMRFSPASYLVKVPFIDRSQLGKEALVRTPETVAGNSALPICHLWLSVASVLDELVFCSVAEIPSELQLTRGTSFVVASEAVEDWMIHDGATAFGGFSLRVARSSLRKDEQVKFDAHTGILEFKELIP